MDSPVNHSDYEELATGFALGALEPDEEQAFQRHLQGCPACRSGVREFEELAASLARVAPLAEPPASLLATIRRRTGLTFRRRAARTVSSWKGTRITVRAVAVAGVLALFAVSLWNLALRDQRQIDQVRLAGLEAAAGAVNDNTASRVALTGPATDSGARATVLASSPRDRGVLVVEGLPRLAVGRVYELWSLPQGDIAGAARAAVFRFRDTPGIRTLEFSGPIQPNTAFAITDEPGPRGSQHPTATPVLAGAPPSTRPGGG